MRNISAGVVHDIPQDVYQILSSEKKVLRVWEDITPLARNEWLCWVLSAKKEQTRKKRIAWRCTDLLKGKRRPCCWPGCPHRKKKT